MDYYTQSSYKCQEIDNFSTYSFSKVIIFSCIKFKKNVILQLLEGG